jgi:hypothetical protein
MRRRGQREHFKREGKEIEKGGRGKISLLGKGRRTKKEKGPDFRRRREISRIWEGRRTTKEMEIKRIARVRLEKKFINTKKQFQNKGWFFLSVLGAQGAIVLLKKICRDALFLPPRKGCPVLDTS